MPGTCPYYKIPMVIFWSDSDVHSCTPQNKNKIFILKNPINQFQHSKSKSRQKKHLDADGTYTRSTEIHLYLQVT